MLAGHPFAVELGVTIERDRGGYQLATTGFVPKVIVGLPWNVTDAFGA